MQIPRRRILILAGLGLAGALLAGREVWQRLLPCRLEQKDKGTLLAFLDTLIPADESPGANDLRVGERLIRRAQNDTEFAQLIKAGTLWLDEQAGKLGKPSFAVLNETEREAIVDKAARLPEGVRAARFFKSVREDALRIFYADPLSWAHLSFPGPPQPEGFLDYERAPGKWRHEGRAH